MYEVIDNYRLQQVPRHSQCDYYDLFIYYATERSSVSALHNMHDALYEVPTAMQHMYYNILVDSPQVGVESEGLTDGEFPIPRALAGIFDRINYIVDWITITT